MKGIILAGGNGTRIRDFHDKASKVLIEIDGETLIESNLKRIEPYVDSFIIVVGKARDEIIRTVGHVYRGKPIEYAMQEVQDGPLGALRCALPLLEDDDAIMALGDEYLVGDRLRSCVEVFNRRYPDILLGIIPDSEECDIAQTYSVGYMGDRESCGFRVGETIEKPTEFPNGDRGTGYCILSAETLRLVSEIRARDNGQYELADLFNEAIRRRMKVVARRIADRAYNINTRETLEELTGC